MSIGTNKTLYAKMRDYAFVLIEGLSGDLCSSGVPLLPASGNTKKSVVFNSILEDLYMCCSPLLIAQYVIYF